MKPVSVVLAPILYVLATVPTMAQDVEVQRRVANLLALSEAALTTTALLRERFPEQASDINWQAKFDEVTWSLTLRNFESDEGMKKRLDGSMVAGSVVSGENQDFIMVPASDLDDSMFSDQIGKFDNFAIFPFLSINVHGILAETPATTFEVNFIGGGRYGSEPIFLSGSSAFTAVAEAPIGQMAFSQIMKVGTNSWWGWIRGTEMIVGGAIGGAGTIAAASVSGGTAAMVGLAGVLGGAAGAASISDVAAEFFEADSGDEPTPPDEPDLPDISDDTEPSDLSARYLVIAALTDDQSLQGTFPGSELTIDGIFDLDVGTASGKILSSRE